MKILYITQTLPYPLDTGGNIKSFGTISMLKKLGHQVIIFSFINDIKKFKYETELKKRGFLIGKTLNNRFLSNRSYSNLSYKLFSLFHNIFSIKPFSVSKFYSTQMKRSITEYFKNEKIDCIWISYLSMSQYLPPNTKCLKILEMHNVDSIFFKRMFYNDYFLRWKIFAFYEWIKFSFYEKIQLRMFDKLVVMSVTDKSFVQKIIKKNNIEVIPPAISINKAAESKNDRYSLLFIGNLRWYPNKDGIIWFLTKIYPNLIKKLPSLNIDIIGELPRRDIFPKQKGIKFYGYQENLNSFWKKASIFIVPIRYGSGLRLKILEAMSKGIPIVSTNEGAEGLDVINGKEILIARDLNEFITYSNLLLKNKKLRVNLSTNSYYYLISNNSNKIVSNLIKDLLILTN